MNMTTRSASEFLDVFWFHCWDGSQKGSVPVRWSTRNWKRYHSLGFQKNTKKKLKSEHLNHLYKKNRLIYEHDDLKSFLNPNSPKNSFPSYLLPMDRFTSPSTTPWFKPSTLTRVCITKISKWKFKHNVIHLFRLISIFLQIFAFSCPFLAQYNNKFLYNL